MGGLDDLPPLTHNMMTGLRVERDGNGEETADDHLVMNKRIKYLGQLRRNVEVRWRQECLLSLKSFHESRSHSLCVGDVVLVVDDQRKRSMWKLGVILDLFPGRDGRSRVSKINVGNQEFLRPIQQLEPLEVSSSCSTATEPQIVAPEVPAATEAEELVTAVPCAKQTRTRAVRAPTRLDL